MVKEKSGNLQRIGQEFEKRIDYIKKKRLDLGIDEKELSTRRITNQFPRHEFWQHIEKDTIELPREKFIK